MTDYLLVFTLLLRLNHKQTIATLFISTTLICLSKISVKACAIPTRRSIILDQAPTKLHQATFMGKVEITRFTQLESIFLIRGVIQESKTHPHSVGEKVIFIHDATHHTIDLFCPMDLHTGYDGYVLGRVMKLNTDDLIVDPYVRSDFLEPIEEQTIETDRGKFPLRYFYVP